MDDLVKAYFSLTNNEQRGIISLVLIILFLFTGPRLYLLLRPADEVPNDNTHILALLRHAEENTEAAEEESTANKPILFYFDPNTASREDLIKLGIKESVTNTLLNYRSKGGHFYEEEDLLKIYGMNEEEFNRLAPFITLAKKQEKSYPKWEAKNELASEKEKPSYTEQVKIPFIPLDINTADSAMLTTVNGIGPVYASRIVKYRKLLRGFQQKEQLLEVYGIDEEVYANISDQLILHPINNPIKVYDASWYDLKSHPYISGDLANIILNYIKAHGDLNDLSVLLDNQLMDEETYLKIKPYLSFQK